MEIPRRFAATSAALALTAGLMAYIISPEGTEHVVQDIAAAVKDEPSKTAPATISDSFPACTDMASIATSTKIGALLIPMTSTSELDNLQATMLDEEVSNFALLGSKLEDNVIFQGQPVPLAVATNSIIKTVSKRTGIKVTFALDEEGGVVQRTKGLDGGIHALQSPQDQAALGPSKITEIFKVHGEFLRTLGVTTVFGPLTDVGTHGADGSRSYSDDPNVMATSAGAAIDGLHSAGVQATIKHLPDNGQDENNTDNATGIVPNISVLEATTLPAINSVIQNHMPEYGMVGNYSVPGMTAENQPASMSAATYEFIRTQMGFPGALMTDALNAESIRIYNDAPDLISSQAVASVEAIAAGADIVIISLDSTNVVVNAISNALNLGTISPARLNEAAKRSLLAKDPNYDIC